MSSEEDLKDIENKLYKLTDFNGDNRNDIVLKYKNLVTPILNNIINNGSTRKNNINEIEYAKYKLDLVEKLYTILKKQTKKENQTNYDPSLYNDYNAALYNNLNSLELINRVKFLINCIKILDKCFNENNSSDLNVILTDIEENKKKIRGNMIKIESDMKQYKTQLDDDINELKKIITEYTKLEMEDMEYLTKETLPKVDYELPKDIQPFTDNKDYKFKSLLRIINHTINAKRVNINSMIIDIDIDIAYLYLLNGLIGISLNPTILNEKSKNLDEIEKLAVKKKDLYQTMEIYSKFNNDDELEKLDHERYKTREKLLDSRKSRIMKFESLQEMKGRRLQNELFIKEKEKRKIEKIENITSAFIFYAIITLIIIVIASLVIAENYLPLTITSIIIILITLYKLGYYYYREKDNIQFKKIYNSEKEAKDN